MALCTKPTIPVPPSTALCGNNADERDEHGQGCGGIELLQVDEKKRKKDLRGENDQGFVAGFGCQESSGPSSVAGFGNWCLWIRHSSRIPPPQCRVSLSQVLPEMMV